MFVYILLIGVALNCGILHGDSLQNCSKHKITVADIQNAWRISKATYAENVKKGDLIDGTEFIVKLVVEKKVDAKYLLNQHNTEQQETVLGLVAESGNKVAIAFRGVDGLKQLSDVMLHSLSKYRWSDISLKEKTVRVNTYFHSAFQTLYTSIKPDTTDGNKEYLITGFSLGGAVANLLAAIDIAGDNKIFKHDKSRLITFGAPRVGNNAYARLHDELLSSYRKLRVVNNRDPVPHIPVYPEAIHSSREVWMSERFGGKRYWKICGQFDPMHCSNMFSILPRVSDHDISEYDNRVMNLPSVYYDKDSKKHSSWDSVDMITCLNNY